MIKTTLVLMEVKGFETREQKNKDNEIESFTQLQTYFFKNEKLVKKTVKLKRLLTSDEINKIIDSFIIIDSKKDGLIEYQVDEYNKVYICNDFTFVSVEDKDFIQEKINNEGVKILKYISMKVDNILRKEQEKQDRETKKKYIEVSHIFQSLVKKDNSIKLVDVKVISENVNKKDFIGKNVIFEDIQESRINGKIYYKTQETPKIDK